MALHIADAEVDRALSQTLAERRREAKRKGFREFAVNLVRESRRQGNAPVTKLEVDDLWGMSTIDGD